MTFDYLRTEAGSRLVHKTLPGLVEQLSRFNDLLERYLAHLEAKATAEQASTKPRVAVYAKKRTSETGSLSVEEQHDLCREYILRKGWVLVDEVTDGSESIPAENVRGQDREGSSGERR
ncbi:recombinase family protein [Pendulispora brunnea]|uniref:Recombinase family protein n=1 Tax=Pendulispora brunnea TaxID=2905690 RepID=A0ABZ2KCC4_9BACT